MAVQTIQGKWIDDDIEQVILRLAKLPDNQDTFPKELIEACRQAKDKLGLLDVN